jgi:hypothetical protein
MGVCENTLWTPDLEGTFYDERDSPFSTVLGEDVFNNRMLLARVMTEAGFTMQIEEWWHFDGADRAHSILTNQPSPYGNLETEEDVLQLLASPAEIDDIIQDYQNVTLEKKIPLKVYPRIYILDFQKDQLLWDAYKTVQQKDELPLALV